MSTSLPHKLLKTCDIPLFSEVEARYMESVQGMTIADELHDLTL